MPDPTDTEMTISSRAAILADAAEYQSQFPLGFIDGEEWTLDQIHDDHVPVEVTVKISGGEFPMRTGLPDPQAVRRVAVTTGGGKYEVIPSYEEDELLSWKVRATLKATMIEELGDHAEAARTEFEKFAWQDPEAAAKLAEELVAFAAHIPK